MSAKAKAQPESKRSDDQERALFVGYAAELLAVPYTADVFLEPQGEDVAQDALTSLVRHWRRHGPPASPRLFAFTAARRIARRERWRRRLLDPLRVQAHRNLSDPAPDDVAAWRQQLHHIRLALRRLPRRERQALLLVVVAELSTEDAATLLGITPSAVKMRVHRARRHLKETLRRNHGERKPIRAPKAAARSR